MATDDIALRFERAAHVVWGRDLTDGRAIRAPGVNLFIWRREPTLEYAALADELCARHNFSIDAPVHAALPDIANHLKGVPASPALDAIVADVIFLVRHFAAIAARSMIRVRLETVATDSCRLFHVDGANLRLLATYSGFGTHWVANGDACRTELTLQGRTVDQTNRAIVPDARNVHVLRPWWVAIQKGEGYPGNHGNGLVHRSPPVKAAGARRLRLCIDMMESIHSEAPDV